jgi:uncharacterized protein (TIGR02646 family)
MMKIEHWHARATYPEHELRWTNLLGVCLGGTAGSPDAEPDRAAAHCDVSRGKAALFLHPVEGQGPDPSVHLRYDKAGKVEPAKPDARVDCDIEALHLNAPRLKRARREIYDEMLRTLERDGFSLQALRRLARQHRLVPGTQAPEHAGFVRYHVLRKLKQRGESE